jgi:hypothetical protein
LAIILGAVLQEPMAEITLNPTFETIQGKSGRLVFRRAPSGKTFLIKLADMSNVKWSDAQQRQRQQFKAANEYAKAAMANPEMRAMYEEMAREQNKPPYHLAVSEYFKRLAVGG